MGLFKKEEKVSYSPFGHVPMIHRYGKHWIDYEYSSKLLEHNEEMMSKYRQFFKSSEEYKEMMKTIHKLKVLLKASYTYEEANDWDDQVKMLKYVCREYYDRHKDLYDNCCEVFPDLFKD